jgi:hypothetical protein
MGFREMCSAVPQNSVRNTKVIGSVQVIKMRRFLQVVQKFWLSHGVNSPNLIQLTTLGWRRVRGRMTGTARSDECLSLFELYCPCWCVCVEYLNVRLSLLKFCKSLTSNKLTWQFKGAIPIDKGSSGGRAVDYLTF